MTSESSNLQRRAIWLGYLGTLPFFIGAGLLLSGIDSPLLQRGIQAYAAVILTFVGAVHWGRALSNGDTGLLTLSVLPSLFAWGSLFLAPVYALPLLGGAFLLLYLFDRVQYGRRAWFRRLRLQLSLIVCTLLLVSWVNVKEESPMKIAITGASGFVGGHLMQGLRRHGHQFVILGREELSRGPERLARVIASCGAVINLAGAPIDRRWTEAYKQTIVSSRIETTRLLIDTLKHLDNPPHTLISTSAIGAFDDQGEYRESDPPNATDFLGRLAQEWEATAREAEALEIRTVIFRFGLVLGHDGGMMKRLLPPFRLGVGGPVGDGSQHFSWIHIDDLIEAYQHVLSNRQLSGVYHLCAPNPVTNLEFTKALGSALRRPTLIRVPSLALKLAYGEGAEVMTSGQRVVSERLPESGFQFRYPDLDSALPEIVKKSGGRCLITGLFSSRSRSQA